MPPPLSLDVPVDLIKDPTTWTVEDISIWLHWLGSDEYVEAFAARGIDGRALLQLSAESSWAELGVTDPAQQRILDSAVEPLRCFQHVERSESGIALQAIEGPVAGEVFFLGTSVTGGRHCASNGIVLSENYVSRRHFQITGDGLGQHLLQDVGSTTGTFLMVRDELLLESQMIVQMGTTELTVFLEGDRCTLIVTEGPDKDVRAVVPSSGLLIGREERNGLCIRDPQMSAFHCQVRSSPDGGYVLDDQSSTNRTWLRLAPDGQQSKHYTLRIGDLFKVGSTLFHVVDSASVMGQPVGLPPDRSQSLPVSPSSPASDDSSLGEEDFANDVEVAIHREGASEGLLSSPRGARVTGPGPASASQLRWEPFQDDDARPMVSPEEYARRMTASRRNMHAGGSARRTPHISGGADLHASQDAGLSDLRERELSSLQQHMRNSRAQTAYTLQQQRPEERRDEDLCKICYDGDIDVVLYPCGHFVLCRWCAQKVSDCPVCRLVITDVIRTYKA